jgi:predicted porin
MKRLCVSVAALVASSAAFAADLPTNKAPVVPEKPNCFSSVYAYFDSTPADCPLSYWGITFYATIDMGVGYASHGAAFSGLFPTGTTEFVNKFGNKGTFAGTPNGLSQSQVGLKIKEPVAYGFSVVGEIATGFDPYSLELANGPGSQSKNTNLPLNLQGTNGDSSRAGQWDNSVAYGGVSNDTYGTLTFGRQNTYTLEGVNAYDPMGGSYAFSPIGWSGKVAGAGNTEDARSNSAMSLTSAAMSNSWAAICRSTRSTRRSRIR